MMTAKMQVHSVAENRDTEGRVTFEQINMAPVCTKPFDADGNSEDNTYARWTPSGRIDLTITNPNLFGKIKPGQRFYLHFTEAKE